MTREELVQKVMGVIAGDDFPTREHLDKAIAAIVNPTE